MPRHTKTLIPNYIYEGNDHAEVEKNKSNDTLVMWWWCSHSCSVYSQSSFLYKVGLTEVRENDLKDTPHDIKTKAQV